MVSIQKLFRSKKIKFLLMACVVFAAAVTVWLGLLYRTYGMQTLLFLVQSPPEFILTYSQNIFKQPEGATPASVVESLITPGGQRTAGATAVAPYTIPAQHMIKVMSHAYQKLNNCGPTSASMAASTLGVTFDQFLAADVMKGTYTDKNVSPEEITNFLPSQGLRAIYRVNGTAAQMEQFIAQDIPVITEQWLVKRGSGELVGHYRVMRGYDQAKQLFTTNDSFNGPNFVIPYAQFDEWWRPFNRGYIVVYKPDQEEIVKNILGPDFDETQNWRASLEKAQEETKTIGDGYSYFNVGTNEVLLHDYASAADAYDRALQTTFPKDFLWYQFGLYDAYYQDGQYDKVMKLTSDLIAAAGEVEEARYYRGLVYAKQGKKAEAKAEFERALQANPRYYRATQALEQL